MIKVFKGLCFAILLAPGLVSAAGETYFGLKAGSMSVDIGGFGDATNAGFIVGYNVNKSLAIEGEYTTTVSDGDILGVAEWEIDTFAVYAVHRSVGNTYFKGKAGFLNEDVTVSISGFGSASESDSGFSFGVGVGFKVDKTSRVELEYTIVEEDVNMLSVAYLF